MYQLVKHLALNDADEERWESDPSSKVYRALIQLPLLIVGLKTRFKVIVGAYHLVNIDEIACNFISFKCQAVNIFSSRSMPFLIGDNRYLQLSIAKLAYSEYCLCGCLQSGPVSGLGDPQYNLMQSRAY